MKKLLALIVTLLLSVPVYGQLIRPSEIRGGTAGGLVYSNAVSLAIATACSSGQLFISTGTTAPGCTTATFPSVATTTGAYLRADGTNWISSTLILPNAATANQVVYATGTNTWGSGTGLTFDGTKLAVTGAGTYTTTLGVTTSLTTPTIYGGSAAGATLSLVSTSGTGSNDAVYIKGGTNGGTTIASFFGAGTYAGNVGIGTTGPNAKVDSLSTTEQLRLSYSSSFYTSFTTSGSGNMTILPSGGSSTFTNTGDSALYLQTTGTTTQAAFLVQSGNGTTSSRNSYAAFKSYETAPQIYYAGMIGDKNWTIYDSTGSATRLTIAPSTGLVTIASGLTVTAGSLTVMAVGPHTFGGAINAGVAFNVTGAFTGAGGDGVTYGSYFHHNLTGLANDYIVTAICGGNVAQAGSGTHPLVATMRLVPPNITSNGTNVTEAATLYIDNAPSKGTNKYALHVADGAVALAGIGSGAGTYPVKWTSSSGLLTYDTSSRKYKDNIVNLTYDTSLIWNLQPREFDWNEKSASVGQHSFGLIAEEVAQVFPALAVYDEHGEPIYVNYDRLAVLLIPEMKKMRDRIVHLENLLKEKR